MRMLVRVLRANVWVSSTSLEHQDECLALVRVPETKPSVAFGRLESLSGSAAATQKPRWLVAPVKWNDAQVAEASSSDDHATFVEIVLFVLSRATRPRDKKPASIAFVASCKLQLCEKELEALKNCQEVVFKAELEGGYGSVEVAVKRAESKEDGQERVADAGGGLFSVQWTSSEALERDLARREASRRVAEETLLERLQIVEAKALRLRELRSQGVELLRRKRAARMVQRAYRGCCERRCELQRQQQREQEQKEQARKAALRAKVVERNKKRTQRLIEEWTTRPRENDGRRDMKEPGSNVNEWVEREKKAAAIKLHETQARLKAERDRKLEALGFNLSRSRDLAWEPASPLLSGSLIHAVQQLHLRK